MDILNQLFVTNISPPLKWVGGKKQLLKELISATEQFKKQSKVDNFTYHEPFFGGGAFFFELSLNQSIKKAHINDINVELMFLYNSIKDIESLNELIKKLSKLEKKFNASQLREVLYRDWRKKFNDLLAINKPKTYQKIELSALLIALNKTCFNGVYRKNKKGEFNVPFGSKKTESVRFYDEENLLKVNKAFNNAELTNKSFEKAINFTKIKKNHLVFLDPPYIPVSKTAQFKSYYDDGFSNEEHELLAYKLDEIDSKGAFFILTNSNTELTKKIYLQNSKFNKYEVNVARMINRVGKDETGSGTKELIITNFKVPNLGN